MPDAKEISMDAATAAAKSELEALSHLKNNKEWHLNPNPVGIPT